MSKLPQIYKDKNLEKSYRYFDNNEELIGYSAYYNKNKKNDKVLYFEQEYDLWKPEIDWQLNKLPFYRLIKLQSRPESMPVVIVENERSALALSKLGVCAVSLVQGMNFVCRTDWSPLNGLECVFLMTSNNDIGMGFTEEVYLQLKLLASPPLLKVVTLTNFDENDDPLDCLKKEYKTRYEDNTLVDEDDSIVVYVKDAKRSFFQLILDDLISQAEVFSIELEGVTEQDATTWPAPISLKNEEPPVMAMTKKMLPKAIRNFLINANPELPLNYIAVTAIVAMGSIIGSGCGMCQKKLDDSWFEYPNLWAVLIGEPGVKKTPSMEPILYFIDRLQDEYSVQHKNREHTTNFDMIGHKAKLDDLTKQIKALAIADPDETTVEETLALKKDFKKLSKAKPVNNLRLIKTSETSVQSMTKIQSENPRGILSVCDELSGWLKDLYGKNQSDRGYYLSGWSGKQTYTDIKIGRGITQADNICIGLLGTIQPDKFKIYVQKAAQGDNDGLIQRFQLAVYPDTPKEWMPVDYKQDEEEIERIYSIFKTLAEIDFLEFGATKNDYANSPCFHYDEEAQQIFDGWYENLNTKKIKDEPNPLIVEHLSKYPKLFASLSLIFHCIELANDDEFDGDVSAYAANMAITWCDYLETHARRVYAQSDSLDKNKSVIKLSEMIKAKYVISPFNAKDIYGRHRKGLSNAELVDAACEVLVEKNWLKKLEPKKGNGRPPLTKYIINPVLL